MNQQRPSPSYPARQAPRKLARGNDGNQWKSRKIKGGWRWFRVSHNSYSRTDNSKMIRSDTDLSEKEQKWCRCILHVASKQSPTCLRQRDWKSKIKGKTCYNPYSVCAKSVGTTASYCNTQYNLQELTKKELLSLGYLENLKVTARMTRKTLIDRIDSHLQS